MKPSNQWAGTDNYILLNTLLLNKPDLKFHETIKFGSSKLFQNGTLEGQIFWSTDDFSKSRISVVISRLKFSLLTSLPNQMYRDGQL
jgi:hypothetical protein